MERIDKIKELLGKTPGDSFLQHALALEYLKKGNALAARTVFERLLQADPNYTGSYYHLAKLLEGLGEKSLALQWYEKGMEQAKLAGDHRALDELRAAHDDLVM